MTTLGRWSPNGKHVFFAANRNDSLNIWAVNVEAGAERQVTDLSGKPGNIRRHNFATDGKYLYFIWEEDASDLWVMDVISED